MFEDEKYLPEIVNLVVDITGVERIALNRPLFEIGMNLPEILVLIQGIKDMVGDDLKIIPKYKLTLNDILEEIRKYEPKTTQSN